jgi:hypothetical protein
MIINYPATDIKALTYPEAIRKRPSMYLKHAPSGITAHTISHLLIDVLKEINSLPIILKELNEFAISLCDVEKDGAICFPLKEDLSSKEEEDCLNYLTKPKHSKFEKLKNEANATFHLLCLSEEFSIIIGDTCLHFENGEKIEFCSCDEEEFDGSLGISFTLDSETVKQDLENINDLLKENFKTEIISSSFETVTQIN